MPMPFSVSAHVDDRIVSATTETAKEAFAQAVEWHVVRQLTDVSISDGEKSYSIVEFSSTMALTEIAHTAEALPDGK
jgi:gamma-glutamyl-gamma-aminobutyrate hydrolase PuuD